MSIRTNYSNPLTHGGALVAAVLSDPKLRPQWDAEVAAMLLAMQDEIGPAGALTGGAVPDGSTVLDMPAVQLPKEEAPVPNAELSKTKKSDKPAPSMNTQVAAEAILAKYSRRKRT